MGPFIAVQKNEISRKCYSFFLNATEACRSPDSYGTETSQRFMWLRSARLWVIHKPHRASGVSDRHLLSELFQGCEDFHLLLRVHVPRQLPHHDVPIHLHTHQLTSHPPSDRNSLNTPTTVSLAFLTSPSLVLSWPGCFLAKSRITSGVLKAWLMAAWIAWKAQERWQELLFK